MKGSKELGWATEGFLDVFTFTYWKDKEMSVRADGGERETETKTLAMC